MKNLILRFPTLEDKEKWLEYYKEYINNNSNSDPMNYSKYKNYEDFLIGIGKEECLLRGTNKTIPTSSFILLQNDYIIGHIFIRHTVAGDILRDYEGHIGYGIRPSKRNRGYGTQMLSLALEKCQDLRLTEIIISCDRNNIPSARIIEKNNGQLLEEVFIPEENAIFKKYKIVL